MPALVALGTLSAAAGGKYEVAISEQGWTEPVHIMVIAGAEPAQRKTAIFRSITKPLVDYERQVNPDERRALAQWLSRERVLEKQLQVAENSGAKTEVGQLSENEAQRMAAVEELQAHREARPRVTQIIADDATPEAAKSLLAEQGGHIAVMSAESAFLSNTVGGRYSDGPNLDVLNPDPALPPMSTRPCRPSPYSGSLLTPILLPAHPELVKLLIDMANVGRQPDPDLSEILR